MYTYVYIQLRKRQSRHRPSDVAHGSTEECCATCCTLFLGVSKWSKDRRKSVGRGWGRGPKAAGRHKMSVLDVFWAFHGYIPRPEDVAGSVVKRAFWPKIAPTLV